MSESMRRRLVALREELEALDATGRASSAVVELDQSRVGRLSRMDAMQAQAMAQASGRRRETMRKKIDAALARLDRNEFGLCLSCDDDIDPRRLDIDPTTTLCIRCAESAEH